jgi:hypothetical protein
LAGGFDQLGWRGEAGEDLDGAELEVEVQFGRAADGVGEFAAEHAGGIGRGFAPGEAEFYLELVIAPGASE